MCMHTDTHPVQPGLQLTQVESEAGYASVKGVIATLLHLSPIQPEIHPREEKQLKS